MEQLLHYVWKHRLFHKNLITTNGYPIEVIDVGTLNTDEGPDFFNAKIKIDGKIWAGNIEIHKTSDDWYKHKHNTNSNYNSVILHVVEVVNRDIYNESNQPVHQCKIEYPKHIRENIEYLLYTGIPIPCRNYIPDYPEIHLNGWLNTLLLERLERKANDIYRLMERFNNSWEETFYVILSRNFGFGLNSDAFEQLALKTPLRYIQKQGDSIEQIEAILFGQAGILEGNINDPYYEKLKKEYLFLQNKYSLLPVENNLFKNLRVRPTGSPQIRLAQLAVLLQNIQGLFSKIIKTEDFGQIRLYMHQNASEYWQTHYCFGEISPRKSKYLGDSSLDIILINTVAPILFAYGKKTANEALCERSLNFLEKLKPESNFITRNFINAGLRCKTAYDSQALIQLHREYCEKRKCLYCRIGYKLLSEK
ncbi:MAG: DUF2851 family protein [Dysgonomonas sp.]